MGFNFVRDYLMLHGRGNIVHKAVRSQIADFIQICSNI